MSVQTSFVWIYIKTFFKIAAFVFKESYTGFEKKADRIIFWDHPSTLQYSEILYVDSECYSHLLTLTVNN